MPYKFTLQALLAALLLPFGPIRRNHASPTAQPKNERRSSFGMEAEDDKAFFNRRKDDGVGGES